MLNTLTEEKPLCAVLAQAHCMETLPALGKQTEPKAAVYINQSQNKVEDGEPSVCNCNMITKYF